jgi:hypothetical protein
MTKRRVGVEYSPSTLEPVRPGAVSPDRALYLPTFSHFMIVNKTSLSLSLSLAHSRLALANTTSRKPTKPTSTCDPSLRAQRPPRPRPSSSSHPPQIPNPSLRASADRLVRRVATDTVLRHYFDVFCILRCRYLSLPDGKKIGISYRQCESKAGEARGIRRRREKHCEEDANTPG